MGGAISSGAKVITSGFAQGMGMSNAPKYEVKEITKTTSITLHLVSVRIFEKYRVFFPIFYHIAIT